MEKATVLSIQKKKKLRIPIVALTCYDAATAELIEESGVDIALVGDSLANTRLGYPNTLPVTMEEMLHHVRASARGIQRAMLVADMPFQSYESAPWQAALHAGQFLKKGGATAVKLEGGYRVAPSIRAILKANIPVMGHLGLSPQGVNNEGVYRVYGRTAREARQILAEAKFLERCGVFALVLECVPALLAKRITQALKIPTIGIGAGPHCDGQILVLDDLLGVSREPRPRFVAPYENLRVKAQRALKKFKNDVLSKKYPSKENSY